MGRPRCTESPGDDSNGGNLVVSSIKGDAPRIVVRGGYFGRYVSSGHLIYFNQGALFAVPFDLKRLEVVGQAVPALDDVAASATSGLLALSADGPWCTNRTRSPRWIDPSTG